MSITTAAPEGDSFTGSSLGAPSLVPLPAFSLDDIGLPFVPVAVGGFPCFSFIGGAVREMQQLLGVAKKCPRHR